jgi:hypothetical protein
VGFSLRQYETFEVGNYAYEHASQRSWSNYDMHAEALAVVEAATQCRELILAGAIRLTLERASSIAVKISYAVFESVESLRPRGRARVVCDGRKRVFADDLA